MKYLLILLLLTGCAGGVTTPAGVGGQAQSVDQQTKLWEAYYEAKAAQMAPQDLVSIELTADGKVKRFVVKQAVAAVPIEKPTRETGDLAKFGIALVEGTRDVVKLALPVAGTVAIVDRVGYYVSQAGEGQVTTTTTNDSSVTGSYNPLDNSNQYNPVDNSNQPVDNSNQNNPIGVLP